MKDSLPYRQVELKAKEEKLCFELRRKSKDKEKRRVVLQSLSKKNQNPTPKKIRKFFINKMAGIQQAEELARELESQLSSAKSQVS
jgi:hypothetical protein